MEPTKRNWAGLSRAFESVGLDLMTECENMETACEVDERYESLYTNYVQLLESIKSQRLIIHNRFDAMDAIEL